MLTDEERKAVAEQVKVWRSLRPDDPRKSRPYSLAYDLILRFCMDGNNVFQYRAEVGEAFYEGIKVHGYDRTTFEHDSGLHMVSDCLLEAQQAGLIDFR